MRGTGGQGAGPLWIWPPACQGGGPESEAAAVPDEGKAILEDVTPARLSSSDPVADEIRPVLGDCRNTFNSNCTRVPDAARPFTWTPKLVLDYACVMDSKMGYVKSTQFFLTGMKLTYTQAFLHYIFGHPCGAMSLIPAFMTKVYCCLSLLPTVQSCVVHVLFLLVVLLVNYQSWVHDAQVRLLHSAVKHWLVAAPPGSPKLSKLAG